MNEKNQLHGVLSLFLLVVTVLLIYSVFWGSLSNIGDTFPSKTLVVNASGKAIAKPDVAVVSFSLVSEGVNTQVIADENNTRAERIISFLKEQGIDQKDIQTTEYNLQPIYTQRGVDFPVQMGGTFVPTIAKYSLTQTTRVKIRDFSKISSVLGKIVSLGANRLNDISFAVDDSEPFLAQARLDAFQKADQKAKRMAQDSGISLGDIVSVSEYGQPTYPMYDKMSASMGLGGDGVMSAPIIEPGSNELVVTVNVVYEIN